MKDTDDHQRLEYALHELRSILIRHTPTTGTHATNIPSLSIVRAEETSEPLVSVYKPSICVVAQGAKTAMIAEQSYRYDPYSFLITSVDLPIVGRISEATPAIPYLGLKLSFDTDVILDVVQLMDHSLLDKNARTNETAAGITVNSMSPSIMDTVVRLLQLLDQPQDIPVLAPLMIRELVYRILQSEHGHVLYPFAVTDSYSSRIARTIQFIKQHYNEPLEMEQLARDVQLSSSAFHKHFKRITTMSPLQYQKTIRLQEAQRLMLTEAIPVGDAAFMVGYESPSQFSREYARLYGKPPMQNIQDMRSRLADNRIVVE
ncbi:AraC family transcriptional regulator [Paenibacillus hunanensis]|uniref:AraC-like DNA-binding protein n=1 Tax=Paenibacillus hunanensis TaxID=539262 RepID=A0ABU1ISJ4_9BACL|nr:AraC family transcriptional regulator [Paenibacillus hunanensis]MDR6242181.1 AraC-like DNA-binding protein [Paenibacillus hunanensis]GGJ05886.1 transcriptional regulator [Paenibacillus hunanensis]